MQVGPLIYAEAHYHMGTARMLREGMVPGKGLKREPDPEGDRFHCWFRAQSGQLGEQMKAAADREASFLVIDGEHAGRDWHRKTKVYEWMREIVREGSGDFSSEKLHCYWTDEGREPAGFIIAWGDEASVRRHYPTAVLVI